MLGDGGAAGQQQSSGGSILDMLGACSEQGAAETATPTSSIEGNQRAPCTCS
jgi:hypothetical protein